MKIKTILLATTLSLILLGNNAHARVVYCTNCSDRFTQALERVTSLSQLQSMYKDYAEQLTQTMQQIEMVRQNVEQYANMVKNTLALPQNLIAKVKGEMGKFAQITAQLQTLRADVQAMGNIFNELYPSDNIIDDLINVSPTGIIGTNHTIDTYINSMAKQVDTATQATFQISGTQLKDLEMSGELESYIDDLLSTPEGQMQALMSGNQLASLQLQEGRQLRELLATQAQSQVASQMKDEKQEQIGRELAKTLLTPSGYDLTPTQDPF